MTKEQLDRYEELSNAVDKEEANLTDSVGQLASLRMERRDSVNSYIMRLETAINEVRLYKSLLEAAHEAKKAFITSI